MFKFRKGIVFLFIIILSISGCGTREKEANHDEDGKFKIVTSFYPMYIATLNVAKGVENTTVVNMAQPQTGCLHDYQLTTEDMKTLEKADVFVVNGAGMEAFLEKAVQRLPQMKIIEASKDIALLQEKEGANPHVWMSVTNAMRQVQNIADQLAAADVKNAASYQHNAASYIAELKQLEQDMHAAIEPLPHKKIVTFHEAFPYFAKEFHLEIVGVVEKEPGIEPSPRELQETIEKVKRENVKALFTEPQYTSDAAAVIAKASGAKIYSLDPIVTGKANETAADAYIEAMRKNQAILRQALQ